MIIKAKKGYIFKRIHDGMEFGEEIDLGIDYSTGKARDDKADYYEEVPINPPPTLSNIGVIIPEKFEWVFANDRFEINGFIVDFARVNGQLAVDVAYLLWEAFLVEVNLPQNAAIKRSLDPIWEYVETEFELGNIIKL